METRENKSKSKSTIRDYLETNDKLLTAFSIFIALTLFSKEIKIGFFAEILSFIFLTISVLIWFELWVQLPAENISFSLTIFKHLLNILTLVLVGFWIYSNRASWNFFAFITLGGGLITLVGKLNYKYQIAVRFVESKFSKSKILKKGIVYFIYFLILMCIVLISAIIILGGISPLLDIIGKEIFK